MGQFLKRKSWQRSAGGSTATPPSKTHKPPFPEGTAPGRLVGSGRQERSGPSLCCNWERAGRLGWGSPPDVLANGVRAHSKASRVGSKGTHCSLKPFKILPEPQGSSQKEDL